MYIYVYFNDCMILRFCYHTSPIKHIFANSRIFLILTSFYQLSVVVTDDGFPRRFTSIRVTVIVVRNRNGPVFTQDNYEIDITENWAAGAPLSLDVRATDLDGDQIKYTMIGTLPGSLYFRVDENTGVISSNTSIIMDTTVEYRVSVLIIITVIRLPDETYESPLQLIF